VTPRGRGAGGAGSGTPAGQTTFAELLARVDAERDHRAPAAAPPPNPRPQDAPLAATAGAPRPAPRDGTANGTATAGQPFDAPATKRAAVATTPPPPEDEAEDESDAPRVYSVQELVRGAARSLEAHYADVWVEGELSNLRRPAAGHLYFTLKDNDAQLSAVMFRGGAAKLKFKLDDGLNVRCRGRLSVYDAQGKMQLYVEAIEPVGLGALQLAFEQLKAKLAAEGLFSPARKRRLPLRPRAIAVVTSPTGAAIGDLIRVIHRRAGVPIVVLPCAVQGAEAPAQIVRALAAVPRLAKLRPIDVVIVGRGGGSVEDLWAFNDEGVARAIAACPLPVISAVGHEIDFTIADFTADVRAATPSAAGELAAPVDAELGAELMTLQGRLARALARSVGARRIVLERLHRRLPAPRRLLNDARLALDERLRTLEGRLRRDLLTRRAGFGELHRRLSAADPRARLAVDRQLLAALHHRLVAGAGAALGHHRQELTRLAGGLDALSPLAVLDRGYSLVRTPDGAVVTDVAHVAVGDALRLQLRHGRLHCRVESTLADDQERTPS
jgi:exodeoxyribonuclease VII large subunit